MQSKIIVLTPEELIQIVKVAVGDAFAEKRGECKEEEFMNSREVCVLLNIYLSTLNKWKRENKIPFKKLGKRIFFSREDIICSLKDSNYQKLKQITVI